jgi:hypothetical protein
MLGYIYVHVVNIGQIHNQNQTLSIDSIKLI